MAQCNLVDASLSCFDNIGGCELNVKHGVYRQILDDLEGSCEYNGGRLDRREIYPEDPFADWGDDDEW